MTAMTAQALITKGLSDAQKLASGATPSTTQQTDGIDRVNDLLNFWETQGIKLFLDVEQTVTLIAAKQTYSMMASGDVNITRPLEVKQATYWDSSNNSRPLLPLSREEWTRLSNRTMQGSVNQYFAERLYDRINLYLWQIPDTTAATGTVHALIRTQVANVVNWTDTIVFPSAWALALRWGIAEEFSSGMPESVQKRCTERAAFYREALEAWDVENVETYFQPDTRGMNMGVSRFR